MMAICIIDVINLRVALKSNNPIYIPLHMCRFAFRCISNWQFTPYKGIYYIYTVCLTEKYPAMYEDWIGSNKPRLSVPLVVCIAD